MRAHRRDDRMTRRLLNFLTALSLLLCVAVSVLWVRSRSVGDYITFTTRNGDGTGAIKGDKHALSQPSQSSAPVRQREPVGAVTC